jgi:hypothetical protein
MRRVVSFVMMVLYLCLSLTGCTVGLSGGSSSGGGHSGGPSLEGPAFGVLIGILAITGTVQSTHKHNVKMRPTVVLVAPNKAVVNEPIKIEVSYRVKGKVVPEWWARSPYTVTTRNEQSGAEVKPESEERQGDGKLIVTFKAEEPGNYVVEVKTWDSGVETATAKPKASTTREVKVR